MIQINWKLFFMEGLGMRRWWHICLGGHTSHGGVFGLVITAVLFAPQYLKDTSNRAIYIHVSSIVMEQHEVPRDIERPCGLCEFGCLAVLQQHSMHLIQ